MRRRGFARVALVVVLVVPLTVLVAVGPADAAGACTVPSSTGALTAQTAFYNQGTSSYLPTGTAPGTTVALGCMSTDQSIRPQYQGRPYTIERTVSGGYGMRISGSTGYSEYINLGSTPNPSGMLQGDAGLLYQQNYVNAGGVPFARTAATDAPPARPSVPADVEAANIPAGDGVGAAAAEGATASSSFGLSRLLPVGAGSPGMSGAVGILTAYSGFSLGYSIGQQLDAVACGWGASWLCTTPPAPTFTPNGDVGVDPQGWSPVTVTSSDGTVTLTSFGLGSQLPTGSTASTTFTVNVSNTKSQQVGIAASSYAANSAHTACGGTGTIGAAPLGAGSSNFSGTIPACTSANGGLGFIAINSFTVNYSAGTASKTAPDGSLKFAVWCPTGSSCRPASPPSNPTRQFVTTNYCSSGSNQTATSPTFTEADATYPTFPSAPACTSGALTEIKIVETSTGGATRTMYDYKVPAAITSFQNNFPSCQTAATICTLDLAKNTGTSSAPVWSSCFDQKNLCEGWFSDPTKSSDYQCSYGPSGARTVVALSECNSLSPTFDAGSEAKGVVYGDPRTGAIPTGSTSGCAGTNDNCGTTGNPGDTNPTGTASGTDSGSCWPDGFPTSLSDLLGLIYKPIECALKWAFIPSQQDLDAQWASTWQTMQSRPPVNLVTTVYPMISGFTGAVLGGCSGSLADFGDGLVIPCSPPGNPTWFQALYLLGECLIGGLTAFGLWRMVEEGIGDR